MTKNNCHNCELWNLDNFHNMTGYCHHPRGPLFGKVTTAEFYCDAHAAKHVMPARLSADSAGKTGVEIYEDQIRNPS